MHWLILTQASTGPLPLPQALLVDVALRAGAFTRAYQLPVLGAREADAALVAFVWLGRGRRGLAPRRRAPAPELLAPYRLARLVSLTPFVAGQLLTHLLDPLAHGLRCRAAPRRLWDRSSHEIVVVPRIVIVVHRYPSANLARSKIKYRCGRVDGVLLAFRVACRS